MLDRLAIVADELDGQLALSGKRKSVALVLVGDAWRPMTIGCVQPGHEARTFRQ